MVLVSLFIYYVSSLGVMQPFNDIIKISNYGRFCEM